MDKVREQFEMWLNTKGISFDFSVYLNKYTDKKIQNRYETWKASRESVVVDLPCCWNDEQRDYRDELVNTLNTLGVKYE